MNVSTRSDISFSSCDLFFVRPESSIEEDVSEYMHAAYQGMDNNNLEPQWISTEECLRINKGGHKCFICDPFQGEAFDHLKKLGCRILGPLCILMCLRENERLPYRKNPVYSLTMRKVVISSSNLAPPLRKELARQIELMGGIYSPDFTASVTHLVTNVVGSQKYRVATDLKLPVYLPEWIDECWSSGQYELIHCTSPVYRKFSCPVFQGLVITVSQIESEERMKVQELIRNNGGTYSGALKAKETTHLVCLEPTGEKYKFAMKWKMPCVKVDWLYESVSAGYALNEELFQLKRMEGFSSPAVTSTPNSSLCRDQVVVPECSIISNMSIRSNINETNLDSTLLRKEPGLTPTKASEALRLLDDLDVSKIESCAPYLDGCCLYFHGFTKAQFEKLKKIINAAGGMWKQKNLHDVSHIVVADTVPDYFYNIEKDASGPFVVNAQWLLDCFQENRLISETPYLYLVDLEIKGNSEPKLTRLMKKGSSSSQLRSITSLDDKDIADMQNVMSQYVPKDDSKIEVIDVDDIQDNDKGHSSLPQGVPSKTVLSNSPQQVDINSSSDKENKNDTNAHGSQDSPALGLFSNKTFGIFGFGPKDMELLVEIIEANGGTVKSNCPNFLLDFGVVPITGYLEHGQAKEIVTNCWLQISVEREQLLPCHVNPLFRPILIPEESKPLKNCVISFSQYVNTERDILMHVAEKLGATCQEYFNRKLNKSKGLLANTHLVLPVPEGNKYEAAKRWNIWAVTKYWVLESAQKGKVANENDFLVELHPDILEENVQNKKANGDPGLERNGSEMADEDVRVIEMNAERDVTKADASSSNDALNQCFVDKRLQGVKAEERKNKNISIEESTPNRFLNPNYKYQAKFNVQDALDYLDSVETPKLGNNKSSKRLSTPLAELFDKHIPTALGKHKPDSSDPQPCSTTEACPAAPLSGIVVCVSKRLSDKQLELNHIASNLGGSYKCRIDSTCTHFIHRGKYSELNRELKLAKEICKYIVAPEWLYACSETGSRADESAYPSTYNPKMSLSDISASKVDSALSPEKTPIQCNSQSSGNVTNNNAAITDVKTNEAVEEVSIQSEEPEISTRVNKELDDLLNVTGGAKRKRKKVGSAVNSPAPRNLSHAPNRIEDHPDPMLQAESFPPESQALPIAWDDPMGRLEREKIAEHLAYAHVETLDTQMYGDIYGTDAKESMNESSAETAAHERNNDGENISSDSVSEEEQRSEHVSEEQQEPKKIFMLTGFSDVAKASLIDIISSLGGEVLDTKCFVPAVTHLILSTPLKSEKFLCCLAAGKWVLHKSYLEESKQSGHFLKEEPYEWGGPNTGNFDHGMTEKTQSIRMAPHRWRTCLADSDVAGAFSEWTVVIFADQSKTETYARIMKSGGAKVVDVSTAISEMGSEARVTHAFIQNISIPELKLLLKRNVKCVKPEYLAFYLTEFPPPPPENYKYIPATKSKGKLDGSYKRKTDLGDHPSVKKKC